MEIRRYVSDKLQSNMYLIVEGGHALVIDPYEDCSMADGLSVDRIMLTHEHYDHISGVNHWKECLGTKVYCSAACAKRITDPRRNLARYYTALAEMQKWVVLTQPPTGDVNYHCQADESFQDHSSFEWMGHHLYCFELPGHSPGSIGILLDRRILFAGDSVLRDSETELRFPGGSRGDWETVSVPRLRALSADIMVYPGHLEPVELGVWREEHGIF